MLLAMNEEYAREIASWKYSGKYSLYSLSDSEETIKGLMDGSHYVFLTMDKREIVGFFCVGEAARVPLIEEDVYDERFLDVGLGMRPDLCGRGLGHNFLLTGLEFLGDKYRTDSFRITVVSKNLRAIKVYTRLGFKQVRSVRHKKTIDEFLILEYEGYQA